MASQIGTNSLTVYLEEELSHTYSSANLVRRAAFDLGGGSIRVVVADVNHQTQKISKKLFNAKIEIPFRAHLSDHNELGEEIERATVCALNILKNKIKKYVPDHCFGVATEAFRLAENGISFLQRIQEQAKIPFQLIDQEEEGKLGFLAGVANSDTVPHETVVIDIGTGSLQMTSLKEDHTFEVFKAKLGRIAIDEMISRLDKKEELWLTEQEVLKITHLIQNEFLSMSEYLKDRLSSSRVKIIGSFNSLFGEKTWTKETAWNFFKEKYVSPEGKYPREISKAILIYSLVHYLKIGECHILGTDGKEGSTAGLLISEQFWKR